MNPDPQPSAIIAIRDSRPARTVETIATTTFRGLSSLISLKASGNSTQDPSGEENKMKNLRRIARLKVIDEGDAYKITARMLRLATSLRRAAEILDQAHNEAREGRNREDFSAAFYGTPILRAQSAEIALKALWRIGHNEERGAPPHHHNLTKLHDALTEPIVSDGYRARLFADIFRPVAVFQLICWSSVSIGSPARSRMSMSFQSRLSSAGRSRTILVSLRARRLAA